jgi:nucleotide-binding universal stress UspA family protein
MRNLLLGIDLHGDSEHLVNVAIALAKPFDAKIWLLHVELASSEDHSFIPTEPVKKSAQEQLERLMGIVKSQNLEVESVIRDGGIAEVILEESEKLDINMIIVGHHKYGFFQKALLGSSSEEVINNSNIPILVVPLGKR